MKKIGLISIIVMLVLFTIYAMVIKRNTDVALDAFGLMNTQMGQQHAFTNEHLGALELDITNFSETRLKQINTLHQVSDHLDQYIEQLKADLLQEVKDPYNFARMGGSDEIEELFFEEDGLTPQAQDFLEQINDYQNQLSTVFGADFPNLVEQAEITFSTESVSRRDGHSIHWLRYHFEGFPLIAGVTGLTQIQNEIQHTKLKFMLAIVSAHNAQNTFQE